jgi:hypothetical protein
MAFESFANFCSGDYRTAITMLTETYAPIIEVFIHKVMPLSKTYGYVESHPNVHFYTTYIGAAVGT